MFNIFPIDGGLCAVDGFFADGLKAGLKKDALDIGFIYSDSLCEVEALFTTNRFQAAPLKHYQKYESGFKTNFVLINSKNANAMTGESGISDIDEVLNVAKEKFNLKNPIMSSTGVIGVRLPKEKIINALSDIDLTSKNSLNCAKAIMTTDSFHKEIAVEVELENNQKFRIGAIAKGAGMINPAMATMLCFITTDASIPKNEMREVLSEINSITFNTVSVDGDTSTNDTLLLLSNQKGSYDVDAFREALKIVMQKLSLELLRDGEGSTKVVAFEVKGAKDNAEAEIISKALSNSLLVKTALFGEDPNWGRIASTVGASGCECDEQKLIIKYNDLIIYSIDDSVLTKEKEEKAFKIMKKPQFKISCDLGVGDGEFTSYGCDLSYDYVKINADYRT